MTWSPVNKFIAQSGFPFSGFPIVTLSAFLREEQKNVPINLRAKKQRECQEVVHMSNNNAMTSWEEGSLRVTMTKDDFIHKRSI